MGIAGFLIPFAFVYHPEILLKGTWTDIVSMTLFAAVSATALAAAVVGYGGGLELKQRLLRLEGAWTEALYP